MFVIYKLWYSKFESYWELAQNIDLIGDCQFFSVNLSQSSWRIVLHPRRLDQEDRWNTYWIFKKFIFLVENHRCSTVIEAMCKSIAVWCQNWLARWVIILSISDKCGLLWIRRYLTRICSFAKVDRCFKNPFLGDHDCPEHIHRWPWSLYSHHRLFLLCQQLEHTWPHHRPVPSKDWSRHFELVRRYQRRRQEHHFGRWTQVERQRLWNWSNCLERIGTNLGHMWFPD